MSFMILAPVSGPANIDDVAARLAGADATLEPFSEEAVEFCSELSRSLLRSTEARRWPAVIALAYWLRKIEIVKLKRSFEDLGAYDRVLVPRGGVFHIPPSNVDTLFVYSLLLALLAGNRNVVRLSTARGPQATLLCETLATLLAEPRFARVAAATTIVSYGHDHDITAALSAACDVRVVWGGDATVAAIREIALPPGARELTFFDRYSYSLISAPAYLDASDEEKEALARDFYNDAYWFDQMACSSPHMIVWWGDESEAGRCAEEFFGRLAAEAVRRGYEVDASAAVAKITSACRAVLDEPAAEVATWGNEVTALGLTGLERFRRSSGGAGAFFQTALADPTELASFATRRDQTLTYWGIEADDLRKVVRALNGRGIDRIVPVGRALSFHRYWDGMDLLAELTRGVHIELPASVPQTVPFSRAGS